jgi:hypothetical protein
MENPILKMKKRNFLLTTILIVSLFASNILLVQAGGPKLISININDGGTVNVYSMKKNSWTLIQEVNIAAIIKVPGNINQLKLELIPGVGKQVSALLKDDSYVSIGELTADQYSNSYTYLMDFIEKQHNIQAIFADEGIATIEAGDDASVILGPNIGLDVDGENPLTTATTFIGTEFFGTANSFGVWEIKINKISIGGLIYLVLKYNVPNDFNEETLMVWHTSFIGDVNNDDQINGEDVNLVAAGNPSFLGDPKYDPYLDLDRDGDIDNEDVNIVSIQNPTDGPLWFELDIFGRYPEIDTIIAGPIGDFSIFRCR